MPTNPEPLIHVPEFTHFDQNRINRLIEEEYYPRFNSVRESKTLYDEFEARKAEHSIFLKSHASSRVPRHLLIKGEYIHYLHVMFKQALLLHHTQEIKELYGRQLMEQNFGYRNSFGSSWKFDYPNTFTLAATNEDVFHLAVKSLMECFDKRDQINALGILLEKVNYKPPGWTGNAFKTFIKDIIEYSPDEDSQKRHQMYILQTFRRYSISVMPEQHPNREGLLNLLNNSTERPLLGETWNRELNAHLLLWENKDCYNALMLYLRGLNSAGNISNGQVQAGTIPKLFLYSFIAFLAILTKESLVPEYSYDRLISKACYFSVSRRYAQRIRSLPDGYAIRAEDFTSALLLQIRAHADTAVNTRRLEPSENRF